jgi:hypothetical protein
MARKISNQLLNPFIPYAGDGCLLTFDLEERIFFKQWSFGPKLLEFPYRKSERISQAMGSHAWEEGAGLCLQEFKSLMFQLVKTSNRKV